MHRNICNTYHVHQVDGLKQRLTKIWQGFGQSVIDNVMDEWHKHLWACANFKEGNFDNLIPFKSTKLLIFISKSVLLRELLLLIFCISKGSVVSSDTFKVRWKLRNEPRCKFTAESISERIFKTGQHFSSSQRISSCTFYGWGRINDSISIICI